MDSELTQTGENWRERVRELQALLDELRPQLIDAETHLAERLAAISAFEFQVRARLDSLNRRLDALQAEIDELRRGLRRYQADALDWDDGAPPRAKGGDTWRFEDGAAASGGFRYHAGPEKPRPVLESDLLAKIKGLYRQLARRFHPDLTLNEKDRAYRTDMMMAINAAYAAGDLAELERLATEPDVISTEPGTLEELARVLQREVDRCQRRLAEIKTELTQLEGHKSAQLMKRAERAAAEGRDLLAELAADFRRRITQKMVERDILETQLEEVEREGVEVSVDDLADIVYNLGLEQAEEGNLFGVEKTWRPRDPRPWESNDGREEEDDFDDY
jgi:DNA repair exonuclease SbcCD ATPase subunit